MKFNAMFQPIEIGPMTVKNRFVVPPMGNNFANTDGTMSEQSAAYYRERAKGGFGLITIEATVVHKGAKGGPRKPCLYDDSTIESFRKVIDGCHAEGAKVSIQLQNAGPEGNAKNAGAPITAATSIPSVCGRDIPKQLTTEEVYELIKGYGEAARRAMEAGADAVEIHMAHGYLVSTFLSPRTNKRVDEFGGCFENRMRFSRLIIEEVKKQHREKLQFLQESTVQTRFRADLMSTTVQRSQHIWKAADWTDSMYPVPFISRMSLCGHRLLSTVDSLQQRLRRSNVR